MCGILGALGRIEEKKFLNSLNQIKHRGPDYTNFYFKNNIKLGHQRLKVIDLSSEANQPMFSKDKRYCCVYNGEIYNYKILKKKLELKNYKFNTNSDTEVLLNSFHYWKYDCVKYFEGMYAFAIFDLKKNELFLARDPVGIKPLFFYKKNSKFIFSSEVKPIISMLDEYSLNNKSLNSFLKYRYVINNETFFKDINELPKGTFLTFKDGEINIKKFWKINKRKENLNFSLAKSILKEKLNQSIKLHLESDIPISSFLSGGVDSSIITYEMSKILNKKFNTFVAYFENGDKSDLKYSRKVSKLCNTNHNEIKITQNNYFETMEDIINKSAYPSGVPNELAIRYASKIIKKKNSVILTGEGADELFCGYGKIFISNHDFKILSKKTKNLKFRKKYGNNVFKNEVDHFLYLYDYSKGAADITLNNKYVFDFKKIFGLNKKNIDIFAKQNFFISHHLPGLLKRIDINTMSSGLEARVPFLTKELINFALSLRQDFKIKKLKKYPKNMLIDNISEKYDIPKYILKNLYKNELPKEILFREKKGFPVPLNNWLIKKNLSMIKSELLNGHLIKNDLVNKTIFTEKLIQNRLNPITLWGYFSIERFLKRYF